MTFVLRPLLMELLLAYPLGLQSRLQLGLRPLLLFVSSQLVSELRLRRLVYPPELQSHL